jgi:HK97 family phage prohead protease
VSKPQIEHRTWRNLEFRVSAGNEPAKISGYGAVFDSPSEDMGYFEELREEIDPRAFDGVMASNPDVRGLFNHDSNLVLGRTTAGTMRLSVDARGLSYEIDPPDTQFARDLMVSMRRKDITGSSFAFVVKRDQWTDNPDGSITRRIIEFDQLLDVSPVTYPAYPAANAQARTERRSMLASAPAEIRKRFATRGNGDAKPNPDTGCACSCDSCAIDGDCASCTHEECDSQGEGCAGCPMDLDAESGENSRSGGRAQHRRMTHTKSVDGENLTADCFIIAGDPEKTDTWELPWKFSTEEKTKSHLRDALARFDQMKGVSAAEKKAAWTKLVDLCKQHGIDVSEGDKEADENRRLALRVALVIQ